MSWEDALVMHLRGAVAPVVDAVAPRRIGIPALGGALESAGALLALAAEGRPSTCARAGWSDHGGGASRRRGQSPHAAQSRMTLPDWPPPIVSKARP